MDWGIIEYLRENIAEGIIGTALVVSFFVRIITRARQSAKEIDPHITMLVEFAWAVFLWGGTAYLLHRGGFW